MEVRKAKKKKKRKIQDLLHAQETAIWQLWPSGKATASQNLQSFSAERTPGPPRPPRQQPIAIFLLPVFAYISMHREREHVFNGNHSKMNYTDSVRDLMIYVRSTLKQMTGAGTAAEDGQGGAPRALPTPLPGPARGGKQP